LLIAELRIAGAHTIKRAESFAADKEVPIRVDVERSSVGELGITMGAAGDPAS